jgi:Phosphate-induced protein 1 conserved region
MVLPRGKMRLALAFLFVILSVNFLMAQKIRDNNAGTGQQMVPNGDGSAHAAARPTGQAVVTGNGINYNGGPVFHGNPVPIYIIWYGTWTSTTGSNTAATQTLLKTFLSSSALGGSSYEAINTTYGDSTGNVSGHLNFVQDTTDTGSQGTRLRNSNITAAISAKLTSGALPTDPNGVYLFITSSNVKENGFCTQFCGFHTHQTINGADIKWAFIGNTDQCPSGCEIQSTGPNSPATGIGGADGMANVITHESEETITDPDLNAWFDSAGNEDADKCNFKFGPTQTAPNGARFNQTFGGFNWMIQMEWENSRGGGCDQTLGGPFFTS